MISRFYYTLSELTNDDRYIINLGGSIKIGIEDIVDTLYANIEGNIGTSDSVSQKLLSYIWNNISHRNVVSIDVVHPYWEQVSKEDVSEDDLEEAKAELAQVIWSIYQDTQDRYRTLIDIYNDELDSLLDQIKTNSETRFNDTPQNLPVNDGYAADNYTTTITTSNAATDGTSKINRIDEIQQKLKDLFADWAFEFNKLVLGE